MFASRYSILASLAILAVMGSVCGTPYPTDVGSTPEGQLLEKRDVDEIVDKVHHLNGFVKRQTGNPPRDQRGAAKDPSSAAITLKTLIEVEDGKIKELAELSLQTGSLEKGLVPKIVTQLLNIERQVDASRATIRAAFPNNPKVTAAVSKVQKNGPPFLVAIQQLSFATDPARLKIQLKALTDLRVDLLKANKDMIDVATGTNRK
ncbi:hypothetical protein Pst134EA_022711 [Puccinia striiformis f. sp. tritici]|uniref:hypothetical protein n=1 Tax=Puccinia striiformis f. sp. tritici TaxID=168172 RepID=UPI002007D693|nr:hypothetical protein Pst134EA_022711 [Puccinia striiformis f. sp. tritici]KAH9445749.1 hypothetical protein Pst134EB_023584 [Puccinia striiformis f. sp. tritici]KAH9455239.1 hypothetical protein Pst134EA_022711 [Puccinia striiformis f. sp. tritici]KAI9611735.1 hypothetical protein KEM48_004478 [Puccinia striiformis f. sp. tritici PST-130]